jgi:hypothetical protein
LPIKNVDIERASEAPLAESTPRCASRGYEQRTARTGPRGYVGKHVLLSYIVE